MRVAATIVSLVFTTDAFAQERFNSPDDAVAALIAAAKAGDPTALTRVLGPRDRHVRRSGGRCVRAQASG
jgi:hypothetical protein